VGGEGLSWVGVCLHPHDHAVAEGEHVSDRGIPECAVGEVAVDMVDGTMPSGQDVS
jgi:hypothetical protein